MHTWGTPPVQLCWLPTINCLIHRRGLMNSLGFSLNMSLIPVKSVVLKHIQKTKHVLAKKRWLQEKNLIFSTAFCFGSSTFNQVGPTIASEFSAYHSSLGESSHLFCFHCHIRVVRLEIAKYYKVLLPISINDLKLSLSKR